MEDAFENRDDRPLDEETFWNDLQATFETAIDLLQEIADAHGIDPSGAESADAEARQRQLDEAVRTHPLSQSAYQYAQRVNRWFRHAQGRIRAWGDAAARAAELNAVSPQLQEDVGAVQEAVEEIAAQRRRIHVKLMRALRAVLSPSASEDPYGPAGEAFSGVQTSIDMWLRLREIFPDEEDAILNLLVHLENLRAAIADSFAVANDHAAPSNR